MANSALQLTRGMAMADILMVIGVFRPDLVRGPAPIGPGYSRVGRRSRVLWVYGVQESEVVGLDQYSKSRGVFIFLQPDIAYVCRFMLCFFLSEFYQTGQLSFMTQADSLTLETNCRENVFL